MAYEVGLLRGWRTSAPLPTLTTDCIVEKYGLSWGRYDARDDFGVPFAGQSRARQNVRNELNRAFRLGELCKLRDSATGKKVRRGKSIVFVHSGVLPLWLGPLGFTKEWGC